jgi:DNA-binding response OmpR family regulator
MSSSGKVLIVEDDEAIATGLAVNLKLSGFSTSIAADGEEGLEQVRSENPDLILLDIGLPKKDGIEVLNQLRSAGNRVPVIVLSARDGEYDKVAALKLGADDYVTKPFALAELLARIEAVLRRSDPGLADPPVEKFGDIEVDPKTRSVFREGHPVKLTHLEFELLAFFMDHPSQVFTRQELLHRVWKTSGSPRTVDNFVGQLRAKLEVDPDQPDHFVTVRGSGYRFDS